ncbi:MAG: hypothetical protein B7X50_03665 [Alishewanella sp. 34-51-39]|nr:MAG: hypothetical protein B7X50_03665 [Alishewanella sp. 34-51-39]
MIIKPAMELNQPTAVLVTIFFYFAHLFFYKSSELAAIDLITGLKFSYFANFSVTAKAFHCKKVIWHLSSAL